MEELLLEEIYDWEIEPLEELTRADDQAASMAATSGRMMAQAARSKSR